MRTEFVSSSVRARAYDVAADRASLAQTELLGAGQGYSVRLLGHLDSRWLECYRKLRMDSPSFFRFCLEGGCVLFACRAGDALTDVQAILRILDTLLSRVNELATTSAAAEED